MPNEHSFTGMLAKAWKKENSARLEKTWPHSRRTMKKSVWTLLKQSVKEGKNIKSFFDHLNPYHLFVFPNLYFVNINDS